MKTLFQKILEGEMPSKILYEDEICFCIKDINPVAPIHFLLIPKKPIPRITETQKEDQGTLGHLLLTANHIAKQENFAQDGFRIIINNGENAGEEIPHLHLHLLAGKPLGRILGE